MKSKSGNRRARRKRRSWRGVLMALAVLAVCALTSGVLLWGALGTLSAASAGGSPAPQVSGASAGENGRAPGADPQESPLPLPTSKKRAAEAQAAARAAEDWRLILVNPWNPMPEDYTFTLGTAECGARVDERCCKALDEMMEACQAEGLHPVIRSAYRSQGTQESLYRRKVNQCIGWGYSREEAKVKAATIVALPGTSEHQLGLAVDITDRSNAILNRSQEDTAVQQWLMANSWRYGFILRYPNEKSDVTGIIYEPWHYRYVGRETAREIYLRGVCLEEYLRALQAAGAEAMPILPAVQ